MTMTEREHLAIRIASLSCMRRSGETPEALQSRDAEMDRIAKRIDVLDNQRQEECNAEER